MTICNIFIKYTIYVYNLTIKQKGFEMSIMIKNAESIFKKFENSIEKLANRFF